MRLMKLGSAVVLISAAFMLAACGDNGDDENQRPQINAPDTLGTASLGIPYSTTFMSRGSNIIWTVSNGQLPPGITLDSMSGVYTGTPTTIGSYTFTITATNDFGMDSRSFSQDVNLPMSDSNALLSGNQLAAFPMAFPAGFENAVNISGVLDDDTLVSIDRRPQNGFLYGLGYNSDAGTVQLYSISSNTAVATPIGVAGGFVAADGSPVRIGADDSTVFGIDFNPTVDRVRVINSAGQNFRMNPNNGAVVDGDPNTRGTQMDGGINGPTTSLNETAYTNSAQSVTVTTQYGVDATTDAVCIQNPPNAGTQTLCQTLSVPVETVQGFDIPPSVTVATSNTPATGLGVAVVRASGRTQDELVMISLADGTVTTAGPIMPNVVGIALQQPAATPIVALSADGTQLSRFMSSAPGTAVTVTIAGVAAGETLIGVDYRPQTGQLYSLGINPANDTGTVYVLDPQTGTATVVGTTTGQVAFVDASGAPVDFPPVSAGYGFDFNPTVDRIRLVNGAGLNSRVNPDNGNPVDGNLAMTPAPAGINPDGLINGGPTGTTGVTAAAYTNSFGQSLTGGVTTQYVIDSASNMLFIQNPPNAGTLTAGQPITVGGNTLDFSEANGFDIPSNVAVTKSADPATGLGFAALTVGSTTRLYSIDLSTGRATSLGTLSGGVSGLAVGQTTIR